MMPLHRRAKPLLGTLVEIGFDIGSTSPAAHAAAFAASEVAFAAVARIHQRMSRHEASSELSAINTAAPGHWVMLSLDTLAVLSFALQLSRETGGVFDVFSSGGALDMPHLAPWQSIELDKPGQRVRQHALLDATRTVHTLHADLGGIAKGYAVDCAVAALQAAGVAQGWVNAGGDVRVFGDWQLPLQVRSPADASHCITCTVLQNRAAATSAHVLHTGSEPPGTHPPGALYHGVSRERAASGHSWTVTAPHCMAADALTKVVAATGDAQHPALAAHAAQSWIFHA